MKLELDPLPHLQRFAVLASVLFVYLLVRVYECRRVRAAQRSLKSE